MVYQPIATTGGGIVGVEALLRWEHPDRGTLAPGEFLEAAERYRLTHRIAERVLDIALGDTARWRAGGADVRVSVNVSASDLRDESVVHLVASALLEHRLPPEALMIEMTETAMMTDPARPCRCCGALDELGVGLSVDDYGTGYSSLQYLLDLPVDELKLDRTFVARRHHERPCPRRSSPPPSTSPTRSGSGWSPRAWRTPRRWAPWTRWAATSCRAGTSAGRFPHRSCGSCWSAPATGTSRATRPVRRRLDRVCPADPVHREGPHLLGAVVVGRAASRPRP